MINIKKSILNKAKELGFDIVRFVKPKIKKNDVINLKNFLDKKMHGEMKWLENHFEKKINPKKLWKEVKTIVILGLNYTPKNNPLNDNRKKKIANISVYARNKDYHEVIGNKLKKLKNWLKIDLNIESKVYVDTSPVFEKSLAQSSGIGWHGKHTNIVSKKFGSWLFLSEVFLPIEVDTDISELDNCGTCNKCINICPTDAFVDNYKLNTKKCISYLTIEYKGPIPLSLRGKIGNKIYGCDDCLSICPWNKFTSISKEHSLLEKSELKNVNLSFFLKFNKEKFEDFFADSPIKRIGWTSFIRNVLIASANSKNRELLKLITPLLKHSEPIIRGAAVWSMSKLENKKIFKKLKKNLILKEKNNYVLFELSRV